MSEKILFTPSQSLDTAVLLLIFNRIDTTKQVFEAIREAKPPRLYIAADGARIEKNGELEQVNTVRDFVIKNIDWKCEVKTLFREENLGCKYAVSSAITWFFDNEEMGIILEDDCLPSQSFFWFCEKLLVQYKDDMRIFMITGTSYLFNEIQNAGDYFFSKYMSIWGWASWRRAWKKYDLTMNDWPKIKEKKLIKNIFYWDKNVQDIFSTYYDDAYNKKIDTWDFQWIYRCVIESGYCITPFSNLVSNLGYEGTRDSTNSPFINMKRSEITNINEMQICLPVLHDIDIDKQLFYNVFYRFVTNRWIKQIIKKIGLYGMMKSLQRMLYEH